MCGCGFIQIAELKRSRGKETKPSPSHTRAKKVDSPSTTRRVSDSSPRSVKRAGSGEKGTPTGSPAEMRLAPGYSDDEMMSCYSIHLYMCLCTCIT